MITEDYVSFEVAKLLKEKGFKEITQGYINADKEIYMLPFQQGVYELGNKQYPYQTLQMAMKWLREKYNIHIEPRYFPMPNIYRYVIIHSLVTIENISSHPQYFDTYEQACEAAIKYCLENLI